MQIVRQSAGSYDTFCHQ